MSHYGIAPITYENWLRKYGRLEEADPNILLPLLENTDKASIIRTMMDKQGQAYQSERQRRANKKA